MSNTNRREFLEAAAAISALGAPALADPANEPKKMIGMQIGAVSFVDEGVEPVLDILQNKGGVNTLFIAAFTYGRGIAGRQVDAGAPPGSWIRRIRFPTADTRGTAE